MRGRTTVWARSISISATFRWLSRSTASLWTWMRGTCPSSYWIRFSFKSVRHPKLNSGRFTRFCARWSKSRCANLRYQCIDCHSMANQNVDRLVTLIRSQRQALLANWREQVRQLPGAAGLDTPTINDEVPQLLDNLAEALRDANEEREPNAISAEHGLLRWQAGFDVTEVVAEYNILRQCLQDAAEREGMTLSGKT